MRKYETQRRAIAARAGPQFKANQAAPGLLPSLRYSPIDCKPLPTLVQRLQFDFAVLRDCPKCESFARNGLDPGAGIGAAGLESGDLNGRRVMDLRSLVVLEAVVEPVLWKLSSQYQRSVEQCLLRAVVGQWLRGEAHRKREFNAVARFPHASDGQITAWRAGNLQPLAIDDYEICGRRPGRNANAQRPLSSGSLLDVELGSVALWEGRALFEADAAIFPVNRRREVTD